MTEIILTPEQMRGAHDYLGGDTTVLGQLFDQAEPGRTVKLPVTPETVFHIEGIWRLLVDKGLKPSLMPSEGLNAREEEFVHDFKHFFLKSAPPGEANPSSMLSDAMALLCHGTMAFLTLGPGPVPERKTMPSVVLIGAYGGEHVGDAAILGGVLLGLHHDYGTVHATIMSKRPEHTRRLASALDTPVEVTVVPYGHREIGKEIAASDGLVFAGGPLMDLPRMLVMHLKAARLAAIHQVPFVVRNVGVGPFKRKLSRWIARQIAMHAAVFTVRTSKAAKAPELKGIDVKIGHDPAFDYLNSRPADLGKLTAPEQQSVDQLLDGTKGRTLIGVNIRPIRHDWSDRGEAFSREAEKRCYEECSKAMIQLAQTSTQPVTFVFFPMNPIQLGASDLESAFILHQIVEDQIDFRVLEADPDVDGVLYLLRRLDAAIAMRFHGCIFCLSQQIPTFGIDYYPGQGGKVEQLFTDNDLSARVRIMDQVQADWLQDGLDAVVQQLNASPEHKDMKQSAEGIV
ncbi:MULTISPECIES: polysaccharide pyruvyl transferase family protein [unclassified Ruegeria]|uniref:polysaccharide pyruvyl transferase family protein n=1 Tax=unclassified Ruegeria TaxID=2625375 RepID=UPI001487B6FA|nr:MULTISPECIES: polysaccharide pyruvyl transferase family protein [unclassified Ruegeria]